MATFLIPAALENVITLNNVEQIKAKIVAEAANGPTTPHADEVLARKGIMLRLPDILTNAGGVTVIATLNGCRIFRASSGRWRK